MTWTPERIEELTQMWSAGHSASAIGKQLGVSKNAVVGKAHRLKLPARPSPIRKGAGTPAPRRRQTVLPPLPKLQPTREAMIAPEPEQRPQPRAKLVSSPSGRDCQWPIGDPAQPGFHFCGDPAVIGKPYCEKHCAVAYVTRSRDKSSFAA
jgi:GcrA cell cycle regulator